MVHGTSVSELAGGGGVRLHDRTAALGISYSRGPSATIAQRQAMRSKETITFFDVMAFPLKADGSPGVSILDYDGDGDLDFFVSNGPGRNHSLFSNQLAESGTFRFVDVAVQAGVAAPDQDGTGSCFGDIDNDGDVDLLVVSRREQHRLFRNNGDRTFTDLGAASGLGASKGAPGCSMGDIDNDGLLDIAIAETYEDWVTFSAIVAVPFDHNVHNKLYRNVGGATFEDVSVSSGFNELESAGMPPGKATVTWGLTMVDIDQDGDIDILHGDDQAAVPDARRGGADRGFTMIFINDGTGKFTNETVARGGNVVGHWMGFGLADYDCNGKLDLFNTNVGDYIYRVLYESMPVPYALGEWPSAWFYQQSNGTFVFPPVGPDLVASPWGWGSSSFDYDNDGDTDTLSQGGLNMAFIAALDNPGVMYQNPGCSSQFTWDQNALARSHTRRAVEGMASGDLNQDGFTDAVSVAGFVVPDASAVEHFAPWGSPFDDTAVFHRLLTPTNDVPFGPQAEFRWDGQDTLEGDLVVEINSANNGNRWIAVATRGSVGLTSAGRVNRSGIGAIVAVTPHKGRTAMRPVAAGAPFASQDSLEGTFGLGAASTATVDVLWPGGVRNRLYDVAHGSRIVIPEIPCSYDGAWASFNAYRACVDGALADLAGSMSAEMAARLRSSAYRAFSNH